MTCSHTINSQRVREGGRERDWERERGNVWYLRKAFFCPHFPTLIFCTRCSTLTYGNFSSPVFVWLLSSLHPSLEAESELVELSRKNKKNGGNISHFPVHFPGHSLFHILLCVSSCCLIFCVCVVCVCVCVWERSWENGLLILVCSLAPRLMVLAQVWSLWLDRGAFVVAVTLDSLSVKCHIDVFGLNSICFLKPTRVNPLKFVTLFIGW